MVVRPVQDSDLHAYVDGWLDPEKRLEIEASLAKDPFAAERVEAFRRQNDGLHALFDGVLGEPLSEEMKQLRDRLNRRQAGNDNRRGRFDSPFLRTAAAVVLLISGGLGGYLAKPVEVVTAEPPALQSFAQEAVQAHAFYTTDSRFAVEIGGDDRNALDSWLSERLGRNVFAPDLAPVGFRLIGGRSLPIAAGAGAQYMYENEARRRLTLFVGSPKSGRESSVSFAQRGDIAMFYWVEGPLAYALLGPVKRDELMEIVKTVSGQVKAHRGAPAPQPAAAQPAATGAPPPKSPADQPPPPAGVQPASDGKPKQM
jgi:anti-sigma factor RsiW